MSIIVKGGGGSTAKELVNSTGTKLADLEKKGSGKVSVVGGLGNTPPEKVLQGSIYSDESGVRRTGTMEDITPDLTTQSDLIKEIRAMLVGRVTEANATPEDILKGKKAYVGEKLVTGVLEASNSSEGTVVLSVASKTIEIPHGLNHEDVTISLVGNKTGRSYQVSSLLYPVEFPPRDSYTVGTGIMVYSTSVGSLSVGVGGGAQIERTTNTIKITLSSNQQYIFAPITFKWIATRRNT